MTPITMIRALLVVLIVYTGLENCFAARKDHLAVVPVATEEQQEVISLLECGKPSIDATGTIRIPVYNPTKYILSGCVVQVTFPKENISRIYYSGSTAIKPLSDGQFEIKTMIYNVKSEDMLFQIHSLSYSGTGKNKKG